MGKGWGCVGEGGRLPLTVESCPCCFLPRALSRALAFQSLSHLLPIHPLYTFPLFLLRSFTLVLSCGPNAEEYYKNLFWGESAHIDRTECSALSKIIETKKCILNCCAVYIILLAARGMLGLEFEYRPPGGLHLLLNWLLQADITHGYHNVLQRTIPCLSYWLLQANITHWYCTSAHVQCSVHSMNSMHTPYHIASFSPLFLHTLQNSSMGHNVIEQKQSSAWIQLCKKNISRVGRGTVERVTAHVDEVSMDNVLSAKILTSVL